MIGFWAEMKTIRRQLGRIGKVVWYLCGAILVLSLPTFSYLIPTAGLVMKPAIGLPAPQAESAPVVPLRRAVTAPLSPIASHYSSFVSSPPRTARTAPARVQQSNIAAGAARVAEPAVLNRPQAGSPPAAVSAPGPVPSHVSRAVRLDPQPSNDNWSSAYPQDLSSFEQGYQTAMGQLFQDYGLGFGGYGGNPFDEALPGDDKNTNGDSGDEGNNNDDGGNDSDNPPPPPPPQPPPTPPPDDDVTPPANRYSFLIAGNFEGLDSKAKIFRGSRHVDGGFVLENNFRVDPFPGTVGTQVVSLAPDQQIVSDDFDGDGKYDLMVTQSATQGTQLELWLHDGSGTYKKQATGFFLWNKITSIGWFDFNKDRKLEVALLFAGASNLFIYTVEGEEFKYLKEIVLPFEPSMVVDSVLEGFPRERRLYVFDSSFYRVATLTSGNPGVFLNGLVTAQSFKSFTLDGEDDGPGETNLQVFEDSGGIALAEKRGAGWVVLGRFSTTVRYPVVVFGDYVNTGARQLFCLP